LTKTSPYGFAGLAKASSSDGSADSGRASDGLAENSGASSLALKYASPGTSGTSAKDSEDSAEARRADRQAGAAPFRKSFPRKAAALAVNLLAAFFFLMAAFHIIAGRLPDPLSGGGGWDWTVRLTDRHGALLREYLSPGLSRRDLTPLEGFSPHLINAVIAAEDKRFWKHPGADPMAIARAALTDLRARRIVSGGSTITMQLARISLGLAPGPRTFRRKAKETLLAFLIERRHSKREILEAYLNVTPTGPGTFGFAAASKLYLGKPPRNLSPAEAALLAGLPAAPSRLNPFRNPERALERRAWVLGRMLIQGTLTEDEYSRALSEPLRLSGSTPPFLAPHFAAKVRELLPPEPPEHVRSALDLDLQLQIEKLARETVETGRNRGLEQVAVVVISLPDREVLAWVGSGDFHNPRDGQLDGVSNPRQPGSALKPFIYAAAFDLGLIAPSSLMADEPSDYPGWNGVFSPRNYSGGFSVPVSARTALGSSLNIPAVNLTNALGVSRVLAKLRELGLSSLNRDHDFYGLGLALGGGEVSLIDLLSAYAALADSGLWKPPVLILEASPAPEPGFFPRKARAAGGPGAPPAGAAGESRPGSTPRSHASEEEPQPASPARSGAPMPAARSESTPDAALPGAASEEARPGTPTGASWSGAEAGQEVPSAAGGPTGAGPAAPGQARRVFSTAAAFMVRDILSDDRARALGFGTGGVLSTSYPSAVKTGTSTNFRDNFCLGFASGFAVGVWAGNFQAQPMSRISGVTGAGELWRKVMDLMAARRPPAPFPKAPDSVREVRVCPVSGLPAGPDCPNSVQDYFPADRPLPRQCLHSEMDLAAIPVLGRELRFQLIRPSSREIYALDPEAHPGEARLLALVQSVPGVEELVFSLNGRTVGRRRVDGYARASFSIPLTRGQNRLEVEGLRGNMAPLRDRANYTVR
jgi:penicillin-binding protein 1C